MSEEKTFSRHEDGSVEVTAANGKKIKIKRPHVLAQYRLVEALGEAAENRVYLRMCVPLLWVRGIDGVDVHTPSSKLEVEGLITRLDEAGLAELNESIEVHFSPAKEVATAKK